MTETAPKTRIARPKRPEAGQVRLKDKPSDYTGADAPERVFFVNLWFMKYGTTDKFQGAALFISILLLILFVILAIISAIRPEASLIDKAFSWVGSTFLVVVGAAIGRSTK